MRNPKWWWLVVVLLVALWGLGQLWRPPGAAPRPVEELAGAPPPGARMAEAELALAPAAKDLASGEAPFPAQDVPERMLVYTARLTLRVQDPQAALQTIWNLAEELGGFVVRSSVETFQLPNGTPVKRGYITLRVPSEKLDTALERLRGMALEVLEDSLKAQDVTEEYVDLQARLRTLQATEEQLLDILNQAKTTQDVLAVYRELSRIRQEIEVLQGRIRYLERVTAMALIEVTLEPPEAQPPVLPGTWSPMEVVRAALRALVRTFQALVSGLIWLVVYVLPLTLIVGLPGLLVYRWWKGRRPG